MLKLMMGWLFLLMSMLKSSLEDDVVEQEVNDSVVEFEDQVHDGAVDYTNDNVEDED